MRPTGARRSCASVDLVDRRRRAARPRSARTAPASRRCCASRPGSLAPDARPGRARPDGRSAELDRMAIARRLAVVPAGAEPAVLGDGRGDRRARPAAARGPVPRRPAADRAAVAAAIERVGVGHLLGRDARELSLGERQLVLIALAVAQAAPILVLDEPTVHLDLRHQVSTMELLVDLNERDGTTIVAVLHDLGLAAHFFPRLVLLDDGAIVADGPPDEVLAAGPDPRGVRRRSVRSFGSAPDPALDPGAARPAPIPSRCVLPSGGDATRSTAPGRDRPVRRRPSRSSCSC